MKKSRDERDSSCSWFRLNILQPTLNIFWKEVYSFCGAKIGEKDLLKKIIDLFFIVFSPGFFFEAGGRKPEVGSLMSEV